MIFIDNEGNTNPKYNLALEEYALRNFGSDNDYLLFYINEPSIIIGRNQNTLEEVNQKYVTEKNIHVVRRISGGGAVYHDLGNLNFSFISNHDIKSINNFGKFTAPVIKVLNSMGVKAELKGRNDILVDERKISGNAQFSTGKRIVSHGTLLFNTNLGEVANALNVKMSKIESKGLKSVRSRVANISEFLDSPMGISEFRNTLLKGLYAEGEPFEEYRLSENEKRGVKELQKSKYESWDWNYGRSPKFNIKRSKRFPIGEIDLRINVENGYIDEVKVYGDFFGKEPVEKIENLLKGIRYEKTDIENRLSDFNVTDYFGELSNNEFVELVYGEDID
ncbi:MAG: lipoate--protein ligase [Bacteroidetes bacterium]|nr:lipoate--protein ligase [Bacteroidota bacterium]